MLKAIVFDFDGVIVDSEPLHYRAFMRLCEPLGWTFDYQKYLDVYIGFDDRDFFRTLFAEHGQTLTVTRLHELIAEKAAAFADIVAEGVEACPGAAALVEQAHHLWPLAISSGALRADIDLILPAIGDGNLPGCFRTIVTADDVPQSKPDPTCYQTAVRRLGMDPGDCLAIEDTTTGLTAARAAGMQTLAVATSYSREALRDHADQTVPSLAEVDADRLRRWFG